MRDKEILSANFVGVYKQAVILNTRQLNKLFCTE